MDWIPRFPLLLGRDPPPSENLRFHSARRTSIRSSIPLHSPHLTGSLPAPVASGWTDNSTFSPNTPYTQSTHSVPHLASPNQLHSHCSVLHSCCLAGGDCGIVADHRYDIHGTGGWQADRIFHQATDTSNRLTYSPMR